jgi:hypothetical protein
MDVYDALLPGNEDDERHLTAKGVDPTRVFQHLFSLWLDTSDGKDAIMDILVDDLGYDKPEPDVDDPKANTPLHRLVRSKMGVVDGQTFVDELSRKFGARHSVNETLQAKFTETVERHNLHATSPKMRSYIKRVENMLNS